MSPIFRVCSLVVIATALAAPVSAQRRAPQAPAPDDWRHGTTVSGTAGLATADSDTGGVAGGAIGWELRPRLTVEGSGLWFDRHAADGFNAAIKVRTNLGRASLSPFLEAGVGLYHISAGAPADMPEFYRRRMTVNANGLQPRSFTDPSFHLGTGVTLFASRHISLQPAAEALMVTRGSHGYVMGLFSLRLAYHFESHPVTLNR
jgi:hypothetical protein